MRIRSLITMLGLAAVVAVGCSGGSSSSSSTSSTPSTTGTPDAGKKLRIAVIPKGSTHEFWRSIHAGAEAAAKELGNVEIIWKGPQKENDRDDQIKVVEDFTTDKVDGIVLAPLDDTALRLPVDAAQKAGIPVVIIDSALKDIETSSFVATDNYAGGKRGGEEMVRLLGTEPKKVILLRYQEGSASTMEREKGFLDALAEAKNITVLDSSQYAGPTMDTAMTAAENLLLRYKDVDGVLTPNESSTSGMLRALQGAGLAGKVKFIGFDSTDKLVEALSQKLLNGLVVQNPYNMGYLGVKTMVAAIKKETVEKKIDTGCQLATPENMKDKEVDAILHPKKL